MRTKIKTLLLAIAAMFCFAANVNAQKVAMTVADQHYAAQTSYYETLMIALGFVYLVYLFVHHSRRREISRFMGANQ